MYNIMFNIMYECIDYTVVGLKLSERRGIGSTDGRTGTVATSEAMLSRDSDDS